ncbi:MAG: hypothetical protein ACRDJJ_09330 [Actinomycetota bacterium]
MASFYPPMLLDRYMPSFRWSERHEVTVHAAPHVALEAAANVTWGDVALFRRLMAFRSGRRLRSSEGVLEQMLSSGFVMLAEDAHSEFVVGVIGRFWTPRGGLVSFRSDNFTSFDSPGYAKAALNFLAEEGPTGTRLSTETRVAVTDASSARLFALYWTGVRPFSALVRRSWLGAVERKLG